MNDNVNQSEDNYLLETINLVKEYHEGSGEALRVLNEINLQVAAGETIAIIGASGSGKTTLLNILGGLDHASKGKVMLNGKDMMHMDEKLRCRLRNRHLGFIYQFHHLLPEFTALENVAMPLLIEGADPGSMVERSTQVLEEVGLGQRLNHKPGELSGGERQRAAIARALIHKPDCVFADEPTGNLDRKNAAQVLELIMNLNDVYKTALLVVTHDMQIAERMTTIYELTDGYLQRTN